MTARSVGPLQSLRSLRWLVAVLAAACFLWQPDTAQARHKRSLAPRQSAVAGRAISVEVQVGGRWVALHQAPDAWEKHYFEAKRGQTYALRIRNRTADRIGVLVSVDGLNVVSGERSYLQADEPMYVLDGHESATLRGWRTSLEQVREFVFVDEERSYANRTGLANGDMGWVRVLAFEERSHYKLRDEQAQTAPLDAPKAQLHGREDSREYPGTGWGDRRRDPVRETWFEPVPVAVDHIVLRYEYERALIALGIYPDRDRLAQRERGEWGFARPPRW